MEVAKIMHNDTEYVDKIKSFLHRSIRNLDAGVSTVESAHIDEFAVRVPEDIKGQLELSFALYHLLVEQYQKYSEDLMAMLVVNLDDSELIMPPSFRDLLDGRLSLDRSPPEIYLVKRDQNKEPYIVEEYKRPVRQEVISPTSGCIYTYYRAFKNNPDDTYSQGYFFEHYPNGDSEHSWK